MENLAHQFEEVEALNAIYEGEWKMENDSNSYSIIITPDVKLFITLNEDYPSNLPPNFELLAPTLSFTQKQRITEDFQNIYKENLGEPILYQWIEKLKEIVSQAQTDKNVALQRNISEYVENNAINNTTQLVTRELNLKVFHGPVIQDRKSVFQGHAASVTSEDEVRLFRNDLLENKKIAQATHNILAYRICFPNGSILQDCDDDGEAHAGSRVLHLLQILNLQNIAVIISRWYGGIHLGPDRFKHINNAARQVLLEGSFIKS